MASDRIAQAEAASAIENQVRAKISEVDGLLDLVQNNANNIRLSFSPAEVDDLLKRVNGDIAKANTLLDESTALTTVAQNREIYGSIKTQFADMGNVIGQIAKAQKTQLETFDRRTSITVRWDVGLDDGRAALVDLNSRQGENAIADLTQLDRRLQQINLSAWRFIATEDTRQLPIIDMNSKGGYSTLDSIAQAASADQFAADSIKSVRTLFDEYLKLVQEGNAQVRLKRRLLNEQIRPAQAAADGLLAQANEAANAQAAAATEAAASARNNGMMQILIFAVISILAAVAFALYSIFGIARPIRRISAAMDEVSSGNLNANIPFAKRSDELGDQARALTVFRDGLAEAERVREARAGEEREMAEARKQEMHDLADRFEVAVGAVVDMVASAATELQHAASTLTSTAEETTMQATAVAAAANQATANVQTVAAAIEELSASAREIGGRLSRSTEVADRAVTEVDQTNGQMTELRSSADQIGTIISLIDNIAGQTNLLALNATIESARAGEAGRGFAVVAQEVKGLAGQTAKATADISDRISGIQDSTGDVLGAITGIARTIGEISEGTTAIAAAMEEQNATTAEVARNIQQAAAGTSEVTLNITGVERAAQASSTAASQVLSSATELSQQAEALRSEVQTFLMTVRAA
ncbi:methyl-accepting chemotaxis protein [Xanthobacteraceae bacterium A53D]